VSTAETRSDHHSSADVVAGFLCVGSIILPLVAARLSARYQSLALKALLFAMVAWVVGMTIAVLTENPLI